MPKLSQGLKAGLAGGVIYGLMIGLLHFTTLDVCSSAQLQYIGEELLKQNPSTNATAQDLFATDLVYYPMVYGVWALIYGVIFGAIFSATYLRLPGQTSKRKGMVLGVPVFLVGFFVGPASFSYICSPSYFPIIPNGAGFAASIVFGYVLGVFYDSFGRLHEEEKAESDSQKKSGSLPSVRS